MAPLFSHQVSTANATNIALWINLRQRRLERTEQPTERPRWLTSGFCPTQDDSTRTMCAQWRWTRAGMSMPWLQEVLTSLWLSAVPLNSPISTSVAFHMSLKDLSSLSANQPALCSVDRQTASRSGVLESVSERLPLRKRSC